MDKINFRLVKDILLIGVETIGITLDEEKEKTEKASVKKLHSKYSIPSSLRNSPRTTVNGPNAQEIQSGFE